MNTNELLTVSNEAVIFIEQLTDLSTFYLQLFFTCYSYFILSYPQLVENFYTLGDNYSHIVEKNPLFIPLRNKLWKTPSL